MDGAVVAEECVRCAPSLQGFQYAFFRHRSSSVFRSLEGKVASLAPHCAMPAVVAMPDEPIGQFGFTVVSLVVKVTRRISQIRIGGMNSHCRKGVPPIPKMGTIGIALT